METPTLSVARQGLGVLPWVAVDRGSAARRTALCSGHAGGRGGRGGGVVVVQATRLGRTGEKRKSLDARMVGRR
jgi:hypothetical protein